MDNNSKKSKSKKFQNNPKKHKKEGNRPEIPAINQPSDNNGTADDQASRAALYGKRKGIGFEEHMYCDFMFF